MKSLKDPQFCSRQPLYRSPMQPGNTGLHRALLVERCHVTVTAPARVTTSRKWAPTLHLCPVKMLHQELRCSFPEDGSWFVKFCVFFFGAKLLQHQNVPGSHKSKVFSTCAREVPCTCHPRAVQHATQRSGKTCWRFLLVEHTFQDGRLEVSPVLGVAQRMCDEGVCTGQKTFASENFLHPIWCLLPKLSARRTFSPRGKSWAQFVHPWHSVPPGSLQPPGWWSRRQLHHPLPKHWGLGVRDDDLHHSFWVS